MQETYKKIAEGIKILNKEINPNDIIIPIGLDGAVIYHILVNYYDKTDKSYIDFLENTCDISSKKKTDTLKFKNILTKNKEKTISALDLRTVTGKLGEKLNQMAYRSSFKYAVLFDSTVNADLKAFTTKLSDKERIIWLSKKAYESLDLEKITHRYIEEIPAVIEIKKYI